ncbi:hypothetical protein M409DRAFT_57588 [Zasmidium cellare ATCC 36951]|uniref:Uncharacterized protein n=1 Tax=Zasmidium cellare ATCC 36951 TaxID=1080233 RepID=A0A6A6C8D6_ZASCE|nr:uncharacterized protein M409DRAFT_57588 [Zasmidium cellare ATCC 36951]KAF2163301.1 hypothetical protein M409DRAFT_57588 [Zasmidium cellare ATCC 36951]
MGNTFSTHKHNHHARIHKSSSNTSTTPSEIELQDLDPATTYRRRDSGCFTSSHKTSSWRHQRRKTKAAKKRNSGIHDSAGGEYESRRKRIVAMIKDPTFW